MSETGDKLADALGSIPGCPPEMIAAARTGYYHDYLSPLDRPASQLVADLHVQARAPGMPQESRRLFGELASRVIAGDFDATAAEARAWLVSDEGRDM